MENGGGYELRTKRSIIVLWVGECGLLKKDQLIMNRKVVCKSSCQLEWIFLYSISVWKCMCEMLVYMKHTRIQLKFNLFRSCHQTPSINVCFRLTDRHISEYESSIAPFIFNELHYATLQLTSIENQGEREFSISILCILAEHRQMYQTKSSSSHKTHSWWRARLLSRVLQEAFAIW